jgi:phosphatidylserine synthase
MKNGSLKKSLIIFGFGFAGWMIWGIFIGIIIGLKSSAMISETVELLLLATLPPITFLIVSPIYFKKFEYANPIQTAVAFPAIILVLDILIVALLVEGTFDIFASPAPWASYFLAFVFTLLIGLYMRKGIKSEGEEQTPGIVREERQIHEESQ